ncbi:MarR family winged helix-turn-helix transcriptional regulator [uncultured Azohydromonas sp.]|uniref:MarR family winged helix-turn-helix transcriptional regulator n=1 Tax=uncultured Azohydromonas sp. TaxID=487342 RepID=UPI0026150D84|nr:MarR family winged helix-turn-helix transcriptional regulator [uncultured Azohydromonas sp.]
MDAAKNYDLTHVQFAALMAIDHFPDIDQTRVGKIVALDRQTISIVVKRLSEKGLIERRQKDKRTNALHITGAGRALIDVMQARIQDIDDTILGPLTDAEKEVFMALLRKLVDHNNNLSRAPCCAEEQPQRGGEASEGEQEQAQRAAPMPNRAAAASQGKGKKAAAPAARRSRQAVA